MLHCACSKSWELVLMATLVEAVFWFIVITVIAAFYPELSLYFMGIGYYVRGKVTRWLTM